MKNPAKKKGQKPFVGKLPVENMRPRSSHKVPTQPRNSKHKFKKKNTTNRVQNPVLKARKKLAEP